MRLEIQEISNYNWECALLKIEFVIFLLCNNLYNVSNVTNNSTYLTHSVGHAKLPIHGDEDECICCSDKQNMQQFVELYDGPQIPIGKT